METNKPETAEDLKQDQGSAEAGSSRREFIEKSGKVAAGVGVAALLGNLGNWALTYSSRVGIDDDDDGDLSNAPSGYLWDSCARAGRRD